MRITFFIGSLTGGGAERVTCSLASYLHSKGHTVHILTMSDEEPAYPISRGIERTSLINAHERRGFLVSNALRLYRFWRFLIRHKTDAYIVMLPVTTLMLLKMKWLVKAKVVAAERVYPSIYPLRKQKLLKQSAHKADGWVFQTQEEYDWYKEYIGSVPIRVIPNAINKDFIRPVYTGKRRKVIVSAGRLTHQKNHALLIKAFSKIRQAFPEYTLSIYGDGKERENLVQLIENMGLKGRVELCGYTKSIGDQINDASLFVLSSDFEGMPNALMEAMALGLPCISTDCEGGGAQFLIENGTNGLITPKGDLESLANAMNRMLSDKVFAEQCGRNAHEICERLAPERIYDEWESFVTNVLKGK